MSDRDKVEQGLAGLGINVEWQEPSTRQPAAGPTETEPRTAAGRALLDSLPTEWHPINTDIMRDHILAIEAEAAASNESPSDEWQRGYQACWNRLNEAGRLLPASSGSLDAALSAERRATVERIRAGLLRVPSAPAWSEEVFAILDEEAAR